MSLEWALVFQGISTAGAIVEAVRNALEIREITRDQLLAIASKAEAEAKQDVQSAVVAGDQLITLDDEMIDTVDKKIKRAKDKWRDAIDQSDDQKDWSRATDRLRSDICGILRIIKQINNGTLPDKWYDLWVDYQCS